MHISGTPNKLRNHDQKDKNKRKKLKRTTKKVPMSRKRMWNTSEYISGIDIDENK